MALAVLSLFNFPLCKKSRPSLPGIVGHEERSGAQKRTQTAPRAVFLLRSRASPKIRIDATTCAALSFDGFCKHKACLSSGCDGEVVRPTSCSAAASFCQVRPLARGWTNASGTSRALLYRGIGIVSSGHTIVCVHAEMPGVWWNWLCVAWKEEKERPQIDFYLPFLRRSWRSKVLIDAFGRITPTPWFNEISAEQLVALVNF